MKNEGQHTASASSDVDGIWGPYEAFYIQAMLFNSSSAIDSLGNIQLELERFAKETSESTAPSGAGVFLNHLQSLVLHAAALSRYFWPARQGHESRAKFLRDALAVNDDSPFRNRDLRNQIEHFDEKLDVYLTGGVAGYVFPEFVGMSLDQASRPAHIFRAYYLDTAIFEMLGKSYEIQPLVDELLRIHELLIHADRDGGRFRRSELDA